MEKKRKIPMRKCIACGQGRPKNEFIRVVRNNKGEVFLDETGKANGRGAYLCKDSKCLEKAIKNKSLNRTFSADISEEAYNALKQSL